ncbi:MAG: MerR family transcriptional regulator [Candidatus Eisenbacteria bacterium]|nr:MerR family transcriptional regulator [Candidatus Eisenbacteria bacterium]
MELSPLKTTEEKDESKLYRSISEVSELVGVKPHVLRYWETQFGMLRPKKNRAGNRMYRPDEVKMLLGIKELLYHRRFTIAGARRRLLDERKDDAPQQLDLAVTEAAERKLLVHEIKTELKQLLGRLRGREPVRS